VNRPLYVEALAASVAAVLLEVGYTRVLSFKLDHVLTFSVLCLALTGVGVGALLPLVLPALDTRPPRHAVSIAGSAGAFAILIGYAIVAPLSCWAGPVDPAHAPRLLGAAALVGLPFVVVGAVARAALTATPTKVGRVHAATLAGAGLGALLALPLLGLLDPPRSILLGAAVLGLLGMYAAPARRAQALAAAATIASLVGLVFPTLLPDPVTAPQKGYEALRAQGLVHTAKWDPIFRVDVADHPAPNQRRFVVLQDGWPQGTFRRTDIGATTQPATSRDLPFALLDEPAKRVLVLGASDGQEIAAALAHGAEQVTAVEPNAATLRLLSEEYAEFTGDLSRDSRVKLVHGDGRTFLSTTRETFDIICLAAPGIPAALNAATSTGPLLADSHLYTVEALTAALDRLAPAGLIAARLPEGEYEHRPTRTVRFLASARVAFATKKLPDFEKRVFVATSPSLSEATESTVLLARRFPSDEAVTQGASFVEGALRGGQVRYAPGRRLSLSPVSEVIDIPQDLIDAWYREQPDLVYPLWDESPFTWHDARFETVAASLAKFGRSTRAKAPGLGTHGEGERTLLLLLVALAIVAGLVLSAPAMLAPGRWRRLPHRLAAFVYFSALGMGFAGVALGSSQIVALLVGLPTRSLTVTLTALLLAAGFGSLQSDRSSRSWQGDLGLAMAGLVASISVLLFLTPLAIAHLGALPSVIRIAAAGLLVVPLGACTGALLPVGLRAVVQDPDSPQTTIAWALGVHGLGLAIGWALASVFAVAVGFKFLLIAAPLAYLGGALALLQLGPLAESSTAGPASPSAGSISHR
jgi:hypothetical protein